jgi:hypothetical protein
VPVAECMCAGPGELCHGSKSGALTCEKTSYPRTQHTQCASFLPHDPTLKTLAAAEKKCQSLRTCGGVSDLYCNGIHPTIPDHYALCKGARFVPDKRGSCVFKRNNGAGRDLTAERCDLTTETPRVMQACCPGGHRRMQAAAAHQCTLPTACPSASCGASFRAFFSRCAPQLRSNPLFHDLGSFEKQCEAAFPFRIEDVRIDARTSLKLLRNNATGEMAEVLLLGGKIERLLLRSSDGCDPRWLFFGW